MARNEKDILADIYEMMDHCEDPNCAMCIIERPGKRRRRNQLLNELQSLAAENKETQEEK